MNVGKPIRIGIAICCYKGHIGLLKRLFDSIERQTRKPNEVIVSCSSSEWQDIPYRRDMYSFPFQIITHMERKNAAQNRNYAAAQLTTDVVCFFDADDIMHPQRIEIIADCFQTHPRLMLFLHNIEFSSSSNFPSIRNAYLYMNQLTRCVWGSTILHPPIDHANIANGHASIRRSVLQHVTFQESVEFQGKEDTAFSTDIIQLYPYQTAYCYNVLSRYEPSGTGGWQCE
jgi:glycosyltransferase involved in cell wall biosynthesis